jgi:lysozyme
MAFELDQSMLSTGRLANPGTPGVFGQIAAGYQAGTEIAQRRQQLEQQRAQYEQQRQMEEARLALQRQSMFLDQARADRAAEQRRQAAKRKDDEEKLALSTKFSQAALGGDRVGAEAMLPEMEARGMSVVRESEENGIPRYRIYQSRDERAKEDAEYQRRINMAKASDIRPEDVAIQRGGRVVDGVAAENQRQAETSAVLEEQALAYPEGEEREMALRAARAALRVPGSTPDRLKAAESLASGPMQNYRSRQQGQATINAAKEARAQSNEGRQDRKLSAELRKDGRAAAQEAGNNIDLKNYREMHDSLKLSAEAMASSSPTDHQIAGRNLARVLANEKGPMSNQDISGILGGDTESFLNRIKQGLYKEAFGGLPQPKRDALAKLAAKKLGVMQSNLQGYVDRIEGQADAEPDHEFGEGMRSYLELNVDKSDLDSFRAERKKRKDSQSASTATGAPALAPSLSGKEFIKNEEVGKGGAKLEAYPDAKGHSIGYGHYGAKPGDKISKEKAESLFDEDYNRFAKVVDEVAPNASPQQRDAMISLAYNIGEQAFRESSVAKQHAAGNFGEAAKAFELYNKSEDKVNDVLVGRRKRERELYESGGQAPVYQPKNEAEARLIELFKKG